MALKHVRVTALLIAATPLAAAMALLPTTPAGAADGDLGCQASLNLTLTPPLQAGGSATVSISGDLTNCTSSNGQHSDLTAGKLAGTGTASATSMILFPCGISVDGNGSGTVTWASGSTSDISWQLSMPTFSANVTGGQLSGDTVGASIQNAQPNPGCETSGLSTLAVQAQVTFS
ncbi:hypothetical protein [Nocardia arthritidis]|uniref:Protein activator n=1 Tax=Nocardia arthritidis TaxID=228602 RepID=A0A6G9YA42_9NOCA|nr:hypothetical protein [Nocardia arthritidis]QIS09990.1 hypothetical protein F5544_10460 [Nocardia arthritidis]